MTLGYVKLAAEAHAAPTYFLWASGCDLCVRCVWDLCTSIASNRYSFLLQSQQASGSENGSCVTNHKTPGNFGLETS